MTIGINRPEASNAINQETAALFLLMFNIFEVDCSSYAEQHVNQKIQYLSVIHCKTLWLHSFSPTKSLTWCERNSPVPLNYEFYDVKRRSELKNGVWDAGEYILIFHNMPNKGSEDSPKQNEAFLGLLLHSLTFLRCFIGGNFCAGYDLKGLACNPTSIKLEQHVTKGPGPMVCAWKYNSPVRRGFWQFSETKLNFHG
ncbi:uncharacterized protein ACIBXB_014856 [Morphnus guianensis]